MNRGNQQRQGFRKNNNNQFQNRNRFNQIQNQNGFVRVPNKNREAMIARNLEHLQQSTEKKRMAQEIYYNTGRSPLVKNQLNERVSVQQRLGNKTFVKRNQFRENQNQNQDQPNKNFRRKFNNNNNNNNNFNNSNRKKIIILNRSQPTPFIGGQRNEKFLRVQNVQRKRGRFQNQQQQQQQQQQVQTPGIIKTKSASGKIVYLKPVKKLANYMIRVDNNKVENDSKHHVVNNLNPQLQREIKLYQLKRTTNDLDERMSIVTTRQTLNERFSSM